MTVPFSNIPSNLRVPLFFAELDASQANTGGTNYRALLIGQIAPSGVAEAGLPVQGMGKDDAISQGGAGSVLALMAASYITEDSFGELWYLPLADANDAETAKGSILFADAPTAGGTLSLYVAGQLVAVAVTASETAAAIATAVATAINANANLPVVAAVEAETPAKVDITAKNAGLVGNDIDLRLNYYGKTQGEVTPAGLTVTITAMSGGATNPDLTAGLAALGDQSYDFIACSLTDTASLNVLQQFLNDTTGRWSWQQQVYGGVFVAYRGTVAQLTTFGSGRNDQHASCIGIYDSPTPAWQWAAALAGRAAVSIRADAAMPLQTLPLTSVLAPPLSSRFMLTERNILLWDGISTFTVDAAGVVHLENVVTTYQKNAFGQADDSYLEVETLYTLAYALSELKSLVTTKYARVKLAADGTRFAPGSKVVTPSVIKADIIAKYQELETAGFVQNSQAFAAGVIVERNASNPNRVDVLWPAVLINQLRTFAVLAQFRLQ